MTDETRDTAPQPPGEGPADTGQTNTHTDPKALQAAQDEAAASCRWAFVAILSVSLFCIITVFGKRDSELLAAGGEIKLPIINFPVDYIAFIVFSPILLVGFLIYLLIYLDLGARNRSNDVIVSNTIFNVDRGVARILSFLFVYWLVPVVLAIITWETWPMVEYGRWLLMFTLAVAFALTLVPLIYPSIHRRKGGRPARIRHVVGNLILVCIFAVGLGQALHDRGWKLRGSTLEKLDLVDIDLSWGELDRAQIKGANLEWPVLDRVSLTRANLRGSGFLNARGTCAKLTGADLTEASFANAKLIRAEFVNIDGRQLNMSGAILDHTDFAESQLPNANFDGAAIFGGRFERARLSGAHFNDSHIILVNFDDAVLDGVSFRGATLDGVRLTGKSLVNTDFTEAWFAAVDLRGTDLSRTNITPKQLSGAFCDAETKYPFGVTKESCPKSEPEVVGAGELPKCPERARFWVAEHLKPSGPEAEAAEAGDLN